MKVYTKLGLSIELEKLTSPHLKISQPKVRCFHIATSPDGKTHNQIDHFLVDRRRHSSVFDVSLSRAADCDTDHYLVVAKVRER
jgi:hypothetical protein